ncbi:spore germination protein GerPE [Lentibacillus lipolyticus]|nr:spore germination protein GerPE [Lentibacillus lipolyticus]
MQKRTSSVNHVKLNGLTFSGTFTIGDTQQANPKARGIAMQKEGATFQNDDGIYFDNYSLFHRQANWPENGVSVQKNTFHHADTIQVNNINIIGVTQAAIFQIGSLEQVRGEARIKHFRRYLDGSAHTNLPDS